MRRLSAHVEQRLREKLIVWRTTVTPGGQPQTSAVWFLWDGREFLVYSLADTARVRNIEANPRVAFNLDGDGRGGTVVTSKAGRASTAAFRPPITGRPTPPSTENRSWTTGGRRRASLATIRCRS